MRPADRDPDPGKGAARCAVCADPLAASDDLACLACLAGYHRDCWSYARACATFGCGGAEAVPRAGLPPTAAVDLLRIDADTRAPVPWRLLTQAPTRWLRDRARDLPQTLARGAGAGALCSLALLACALPFGIWPRRWVPFAAVTLVGAALGLVAPFLAPFQVRAPRTTALASLAAVLWFVQTPAGRGLARDVDLSLVLLLGSLAATCVAEPALRWVRGLRGAAVPAPARFALTWATSFLVWLSVALSQDGARAFSDPKGLLLLAAFSVMAGAFGAGPMERAKEGYRAELAGASPPALSAGTAAPPGP